MHGRARSVRPFFSTRETRLLLNDDLHRWSSLVVLASQLLEGDRLTSSDLRPRTSNFSLERSPSSVFAHGGLPLKVPKLCQNSLSPGELPHPSEGEPLPLPDVDAERILDILLAPIDELHDNRVLRVGDREAAAPPVDRHRMPDCVLRSRPGCRGNVDAECRERVMHRAMGSLGTSISQVLRARLELPAAERFGQARCIFLAIIDNHIHIRCRPRNAESRDG